jgi:dihydroorotate dehydrogenase (fumarate)
VAGIAVESEIRQMVLDLKRLLRIPVAMKLSPYFTAFANFARQLDAAGVDGLVLFNRFYQPDVDIRTMKVGPALELSHSDELRLRLRWLAILHQRVRASLAASGGVETPADGVKAILAGAHAVQVVSAVLRHGPGFFKALRDSLTSWMEWHHLQSLDDVRGRAGIATEDDPSAFERGQYIRTLHSWGR